MTRTGTRELQGTGKAKAIGSNPFAGLYQISQETTLLEITQLA